MVTIAPPSLRAEHAAHTKARLLEAAIDVILEGGADELGLRVVAKRAGVSAPTAYRHFPTKAELVEAMVAFIDERMSIPRRIDTIEDFIEALPFIHQSFAADARLMRAYVRTRAAADVRDAGQRARKKRVDHALRRSLPDLDGDGHAAFGALLQQYSSSSGWELWRDRWGLEGERAGRVAAWAVRALYAAIVADPEGFARAARGSAPASATAPPARKKGRRKS